MPPAHQSLCATNNAVGQIELWLVINFELIGIKCGSQIPLKFNLAPAFSIQLLAEEYETGATGILGPIHSRVRIF